MTLEIDPGNSRQLRDWDGDHGSYWAEYADAYDASVARYHPTLLAAADVQPGDRILDIGCGAGQVATDLVRSIPGAHAVGVDLSSAQLEVARVRSAGLDAEFVQADAQVHDFGTGWYDLVVSRTGSMFFADPEAAFANLARAVKPGGRLAILVWRGIEENEWLREIFGALRVGRDLSMPPPGAPGPLAQSDPDVVGPMLTRAGWLDPTFTRLDEPLTFGPDADWATTWTLGQMAWLLTGLDESKLREAADNLHAVMAAHQTDQGVQLESATWLVTASR